MFYDMIAYEWVIVFFAAAIGFGLGLFFIQKFFQLCALIVKSIILRKWTKKEALLLEQIATILEARELESKPVKKKAKKK